jgi:hypothetical protein
MRMSRGGPIAGPIYYLAVLDAAGTALLTDASYSACSRGAAIAVDSSGYIHAAGAGGVVGMFGRTPDTSGLFGIANAAGDSITSLSRPADSSRSAAGTWAMRFGWTSYVRLFHTWPKTR